MARELYSEHGVFRAALEECAAAFAVHIGPGLVELVLDTEHGDARLVDSMGFAQASVFSVEHALARLWSSWGIEPDVVVGHSLGAYAAACVAGVFTLTDAVAMVAERARLLTELPPGAMTAVALPESEVLPRLSTGLAIAAVNTPGQCVVSGPVPAMAAFEDAMRAEGVRVRRLRIPVAGHSPAMDAITERLREYVAGLTLRPPTVPMVSDHTGLTLTDEQAVDPGYWAAHLRGTVRFSAALDTVLAGGERVLLEVGPGQTVSPLVRQHPRFGPGHEVVPSLPHPADGGSDLAQMLSAAGALWQRGHDLRWRALHDGRRRRRVPLPTYPFEPLRYHIDPDGPVTIEPVASATGMAEAASEAAAPPRTKTERTVAAAFADVLGTPTHDLSHDFFALGGDSLIATQLAARIRAEIDVSVSVRDVFAARTVAALAELVDARLDQ
jgi:acyl transferase domain-containing protein